MHGPVRGAACEGSPYRDPFTSPTADSRERVENWFHNLLRVAANPAKGAGQAGAEGLFRAA
jgi:hypothetical protein